MKKKGVEVYFVIYLATIISFFAIEGEVIEYKKRQAALLLEMARDKIDDLIVLNNYNYLVDKDTLFMQFSLGGEYERESFRGTAVISTEIDSSVQETADELSFEYPLYEKGTGDWYYATIPMEVFDGYGDAEFKLMAQMEVMPSLSERLWYLWFEKFKDEKVVDRLYENIRDLGKLALKKKVPYTLVPNKVGVLSEFTLNFSVEVQPVVQGLKWQTKLFVGGVRDVKDFTLEVVEGEDLITEIVVGSPETLISGLGEYNGLIRFIGVRRGDSQTKTTELSLKVIPPEWEVVPTLNEMYTGDVFEIDGRLKNIPFNVISMRITGPFPRSPQLVPMPKYNVGPLKKAGSLKYQMLVNGIDVPKMFHSVRVVEPPPPSVNLVGRDGNVLLFKVVCYGRGNGLDYIKRLANIADVVVSDKQVKTNTVDYDVSVRIQNPRKTPSDGKVRVQFKTIDNNANSFVYTGQYAIKSEGSRY